MDRCRKWLLATSLGLCTTSGCATQTVGFLPIASHTLRVAADQEVDVVWLVKDEGKVGAPERKQTVLRCHNTDQGPVCDPARSPQ